MRKKSNIILANCPIVNGNRGCQALSVSVMELIDELLTQCGVDYSFFLPDAAHNDNAIHEIFINGRTIRYRDCSYPVSKSLHSTFLGWGKMLHKRDFSSFGIFLKADYILDIGQGDSFADIYGEKRFQSIDNIHVLARLLQKPYCFLPQTIGPFSNTAIRNKAITSLAKTKMCMVRDRQSYDYVKSNVSSQKNLLECIDMAFFMPYKVIHQDDNYTHVGINISALLWNGGYTRDNQFGLFCDYQSLVRQLITLFLQQPNVKVHLIPHVVGVNDSLENDYFVSYELWKEFSDPNLILAPFAPGPIEIKSYIAGLDFFVGARMHATIGAFSSGVPVVPMAYSRKFNGLFLETLSYQHMVDMKTMDVDTILNLVLEAFKQKQNIKEEISHQMSTTVLQKKQLIMDGLRQFFNL